VRALIIEKLFLQGKNIEKRFCGYNCITEPFLFILGIYFKVIYIDKKIQKCGKLKCIDYYNEYTKIMDID
jgi:hypothetical protein